MDNISGFWLSPSYACNNRCRWCYVGGLLSEAPKASLSDIKYYIDQMVKAGARTCILVGGEPSVYPDILETIAYATDCGISVKMMTNGRRLSSFEFVLKLKEVGLSYCSISLEGPERLHDEITRIPGSFEESFQGILNCQRANLPVNSITTISSFNKESLDEFLGVLHQINLRRAVFNMCSSQPSGYGGNSEGTIDLADYARIVERIGLKYDFVCFYALVPLCLFDQEKLKILLKLGRLRVSCSLFGNVVAIDPRGAMLPCTHMAGLQYGNLNEPGAIEKFLAKKTKEMQFLSSYAPNQKCSDCSLWNTCRGGCNLIWFSRNADEHIVGLPV